MSDGRDKFGSRVDFYFAAVGSAVGFGNIWRFPSLAFKYGGGAFFIPYIMALFIIGIPMLFLEIVLGQFYQTGDIGVFTSFHKRLSGVGVSSIVCGYILITYYSVLIVWCINAFLDSGSSKAPWNGSVSDYHWDLEKENATDVATDYFFDKVIGMESLDDSKTPTRLVGANVGYSFLVWVIVWACTAFGLKLTGRITYFTMGFPILLLFIFLFKGISLEGSGDGIVEYIGRWDLKILTDQPACWSEAVSQIFFSLSVTFGVMTAYASHLPRNEPAFFNSCVVAVSNCMFSFIAGFAVYAAVGHLGYLTGLPVHLVNESGFGLVFGLWPLVFSTFNGGAHWVRLLFLNLILLGIDSAFSLLEGVVTCLMDTTLFKDTPKWLVSGVICVIGFLLSFIYCTDAGLFFLDVIDYYLNFMLIIVGFFESFGVGWIYGIEAQIEKFGLIAVFSHMVANFGAIIFGCAIWYGVKGNSVGWGFLAFGVTWIVGMLVTNFVFLKNGSYYELAFGNMLEFKEKLEPVVGTVPILWCFLIKQIVPHVLLILFVNLATSTTDKGKSTFGHYGDYEPAPYQVLGILTFSFMIFLFLLGLVFPSAYDILQPHSGIHEDEKKADQIKKVDEFTGDA